jgi:membrane-bound metal-dependent hydrolase YbcI (DUF457 family)
MPLPLAHALIGASIAGALIGHDTPAQRTKLLAAAAVSVMPDLDFIPVWFMGYERDIHRGFTHSIGFGGAVAMVIFLALGRERWREAAAYSLALLSHGILDALSTVDGRGIALLWPFAEARWKLAMVELPTIALDGTAIEIALRGSLAAILQAAPIAAVLALPLLVRSYRRPREKSQLLRLQ